MKKKKKEIKSKTYFYFFDSIFKDRKRKDASSCKDLFINLFKRHFKIDFQLDSFEKSEIGFYVKTEKESGIHYEFSCEHLGIQIKLVLKKFKNNEYDCAEFMFLPIHKEFTLYSLLKDINKFKNISPNGNL